MKKTLLISIQPQHLLNILNGDKTYEVRKVVPKWVLDKLERGETVEAYLYCTKGKPYLYNAFGRITPSIKLFNDLDILNGTIPVKVVIDGYVKYVDCSECSNNENGYECQNDFMYLLSVDPILRKETCLTSDEIEDYGNGKDLYALHISKVEILDEPMKLGDFVTWDIKHWYTDENEWQSHWKPVTRPPQNCMSVWVK